MAVTKTQFLSGLACAKRAYFDQRSPELGAPPDKGLVLRLQQGAEIGRLARRLWKGTLVNVPSSDMERAAGETQRLMAAGEDVLFEAAFLGPRAEARVDVLERTEGGWHVVEVKSSKEAKEEHVLDLAFQVLTLEECGVRVVRASLLLIADGFVAGAEELDPQRFFRLEDSTDLVLQAIPGVAEAIAGHLSVVGADGPPEVVQNVHCVRGDGCPYVPHCFRGLPANDLTTLPRVSAETVLDLHGMGVRDIAEIPEEFRLSPRQRLIAGVVRDGRPFVSPRLAGVLDGLARPLHFIDFEACNSALPLFPGATPYMVVPFQWSDHVLHADGRTEHKEFLHRDGGDPRVAFAESLWTELQDAGTVLHYSHYEKSRVADLAKAGVAHGEELVQLMAERGRDLERIVIEGVYVEEFRGRSSIKAVYPALVPDGGYSDLEVQGGEQAAAEYRRMFSPATTPEERDLIAASLLAYCGRDTLAMLQVFQALERIADGTLAGEGAY